jgi:hypothetical protein
MRLATAALAAVSLSACTPPASDRDDQGVPVGAVREYPGTPGGSGLLEGPFATLVDDGRVLAVVTLGSSSCHRVARAIEWSDEGASIEFTSAGGAVCTADLAAHTHEFDVPAQLRGRRLSIELSYDDWAGIDRLTAG